MAKPQVLYVCNECGASAQKWAGQCSHCGAWNSITEETISSSVSLRRLDSDRCSVSLLSDITVSPDIRWQTQYEELNRVLGGGIVKGSVVLMGGEPGVGKSTLLLQMLCQMQSQPANALKALYVTGEESLQQVTLRSRRLELPQTHLGLLSETQLERILATLQSERPSVVIIDSGKKLVPRLVRGIQKII